MVITHSGLAVMRMSFGGEAGRADYAAPLAEYDQELARGWVNFEAWWERVVFEQAGNFSRGDLILALAHKDGGAHVDPELGDAYAALSRGNLLGLYSLPSPDSNRAGIGIAMGPRGGQGEPFASQGEPWGSPVPANVRQVAYELEQTIGRLPEFVSPEVSPEEDKGET